MSNLGQPEGSACCNHSETQPDRNSIAEYFRKDGEPDKDDQKAGHVPSNFTSLTKANDKVLNSKEIKKCVVLPLPKKKRQTFMTKQLLDCSNPFLRLSRCP